MTLQHYNTTTLQHYNTRYNQAELNNLKILETKRTRKDDIVYIAVDNPRDIGDIYARKAECRSDNTTVKNYLPPQFFDRFSALNKLCATKRQEDAGLKTQMRFGEGDVEILTKRKGGEEPFRMVDLATFIGDNAIPEFDFNIKWRIQVDRPPRRRVYSSSPEPTNRRTQMSDQPSRRKTLTRQLSKEEEESRKKQRKNVEGMEVTSDADLPSKENADETL